jgi:FixJ family two-component response regulator
MADERVYLVDDDPSVRSGLSRLLRSAELVVEPFASAADFLNAERTPAIACLVLDVRMPELDGMALHAELCQRSVDLPVIFLTGHGDIPMSVAAMKQGACDFLTKPVDDKVLLRAVRLALDRHRDLSREREAADAARTRVAYLTPREQQVLRCVIGGAMNKQIAHRLGIAEKTVKIHRGRVMEKMAAGSVAELIGLCRQAGIDAYQESLSPSARVRRR